MKIKSLKELIDRGQTEGATTSGVDYLVKNPSDFINLVKQDIVLAQLYAKFFNLDQIEKIAKGNSKFFTALYMLVHEPGVSTVSVVKSAQDFDKNNILSCIIKMIDQFKYETVDPVWAGNKTYYRAVFQGETAFRTDEEYSVESIHLINPAVCERAYAHSSLHVNRVKKEIKEIVDTLLNKLESSKIKENILDEEFLDCSLNNIFSKKYYLIDSMVINKDYEWLEKITRCISKVTLEQQLEKVQERMGTLTSEVSNQFDRLIELKKQDTSTIIPSAPPAYEITPKQYLDALARIAELEQQVEELKIQLQTGQLKAANEPSTLNAYAQSANAVSATFYPKFT